MTDGSTENMCKTFYVDPPARGKNVFTELIT